MKLGFIQFLISEVVTFFVSLVFSKRESRNLFCTCFPLFVCSDGIDILWFCYKLQLKVCCTRLTEFHINLNDYVFNYRRLFLSNSLTNEWNLPFSNVHFHIAVLSNFSLSLSLSLPHTYKHARARVCVSSVFLLKWHHSVWWKFIDVL